MAKENEKTHTCTFTGLTAAQAKALATWYSGQGEQDADEWFDVNCPDGVPCVDTIDVRPSGDVEVHTRD